MMDGSTRGQRPPRIIVAGEFRSGKSTVVDALIRSSVASAPARARQMPLLRPGDTPAVRFSHAPAGLTITVAHRKSAERERTDTLERALCMTGLSAIRVQTPFAALAGADVFEAPSRRNGGLDDKVIESLNDCDLLVWCTIGSQAWRLSEQSIIERLDARTRKNALLTVTRADLFRTEADRGKVAERLWQAAGPHFADILFLGAPPTAVECWTESDAVWTESGARALSDRVSDRLGPSAFAAAQAASTQADAAGTATVPLLPEPARDAAPALPAPAAEPSTTEADASEPAEAAPVLVLPAPVETPARSTRDTSEPAPAAARGGEPSDPQRAEPAPPSVPAARPVPEPPLRPGVARTAPDVAASRPGAPATGRGPARDEARPASRQSDDAVLAEIESGRILSSADPETVTLVEHAAELLRQGLPYSAHYYDTIEEIMVSAAGKRVLIRPLQDGRHFALMAHEPTQTSLALARLILKRVVDEAHAVPVSAR